MSFYALGLAQVPTSLLRICSVATATVAAIVVTTVVADITAVVAVTADVVIVDRDWRLIVEVVETTRARGRVRDVISCRLRGNTEATLLRGTTRLQHSKHVLRGGNTGTQHVTPRYATQHYSTSYYTTPHHNIVYPTTPHNTIAQDTTLHNTTPHRATQHNNTSHYNTQHHT